MIDVDLHVLLDLSLELFEVAPGFLQSVTYELRVFILEFRKAVFLNFLLLCVDNHLKLSNLIIEVDGLGGL